MPLSRHERDNELGPKQTRAFVYFFGLVLLIGVVLGTAWVIAGLIHIAFFG